MLSLSPRQLPVAIAVVYALSGALWIVFSDRAWAGLTGLSPDALQRIQTYKGLGYVLVTAVLIWWLTDRALGAAARAEAARYESESRYRQVFETTGSICLLVDVATLEIVEANPAAVRFYGWARGELVGKPFGEIDTLGQSELRATLAGDSRAERSLATFRHRLRSAVVREVEVHSSPMRINGRDLRFMIVHDVTDRVRAERRLAESEANYRRALELASDAILVTDRHGVVLEANARAEELLRRDRDEIIGRTLHDFVPAEEQATRPLFLRELVDRGAALTEGRLARRDGSLVEVEVNARDLGDGRFQAIVRDISERRRLEDQLRRAQKMEAVAQLTGGIAHDLNNLLTVVLANAELMTPAIPPDRDDLRTDLTELQQAARRGAQMIQKLLGFSRHAALTYQVFDLGRVVEEFVGTLRRLLPSSIEVHPAQATQPVRVRADRAAIEQILVNLATNARDALPQGGRLDLAVRRVDVTRQDGEAEPGAYGCLVVRDNGVGMDRHVREHVFEPFFTTKPPGAGSGLGMAMIYGLTQQHGGFIELESEAGRGTEVRVFLPLAREDQALDEAPPPAADAPAGGRERILLVEDEEGLRRVARRALERVGYEVLTATDGLEALELFRSGKGKVDLVVTDVLMPRLGGIALYRTLREEGAKVRFLFTSGYAAEEIMKGEFPEAEPALLQKPWTISDLTARVREVLDAPIREDPA